MKAGSGVKTDAPAGFHHEHDAHYKGYERSRAPGHIYSIRSKNNATGALEKRLSNVGTMFADSCSTNTKMAMPISNSIDRVFAFEEVVAACEYMESNQAKGKLVVSVRA